MSNEYKIDTQKRRSIKTFASVAVIGAMASPPAIASLLTGAKPDSDYDVLECMLILRAGNTHLHMLMHNKGNKDIVVSEFMSQALQFDNVKLNVSNALAQTAVVRTQERIMVRLDLENSLQARPSTSLGLDLSSVTSLLSQGTRVATVSVHVHSGVGILVKPQQPVFAMNAWSAMYRSKHQVS